MTANKLLYGTKEYCKQFLEFCEPLIQFLNIDNATYYNINVDGSLVNIHSSYKWIEGYIAEQSYMQDPHMVHPNNIEQGFCLLLVTDNYNYKKYDDVILYNEKNKNLFSYGFTYIVKTNLDFTAFCFTTNKDNYIINQILNNVNMIELFIEKLSNQMRSLLTKSQLNVNLAELKGEQFIKQNGIIFSH